MINNYNLINGLLFTEAIQKNSLTAKATMKEIELPFTKWLIGARNRGGNRAKRMQKAKEKRQQREKLFKCRFTIGREHWTTMTIGRDF
jgi:hypothetical protein